MRERITVFVVFGRLVLGFWLIFICDVFGRMLNIFIDPVIEGASILLFFYDCSGYGIE